jgi:hypothetical protein
MRTTPSGAVPGQFTTERFALHDQILGGRGCFVVGDELDEFAALEVERRVADADKIGFGQQLGGHLLTVDIDAVVAAQVDDLVVSGGCFAQFRVVPGNVEVGQDQVVAGDAADAHGPGRQRHPRRGAAVHARRRPPRLLGVIKQGAGEESGHRGRDGQREAPGWPFNQDVPRRRRERQAVGSHRLLPGLLGADPFSHQAAQFLGVDRLPAADLSLGRADLFQRARSAQQVQRLL